VQISYPKSFLKLLLIGFALVMLPLIAAFVNANIQFNKLTKQSLFNMSQAVETTRNSQILLEELAIMERSARQYFVLHDELLLNNFTKAHQRLTKATNILMQQPITKPQHAELLTFNQQESLLLASVSNSTEFSTFDDNMVQTFNNLTKQANLIIEQNNQLIDQESASFKTQVSQVKKSLFWQMLTIFPFVVIIAGLITWMIARPIRRMDAAINQLGNGNYEEVIEINGPGDLRQLGSRLDWLRVALKDVHQQKERFLQQASHELKTPLTAIREASELLNDGVAGALSPQQNKIVAILRDNSLRLQKMIENLLKYTEIQFNANKINQSQLPLDDIVGQVIKAYALTITHKKISVKTQIESMTMLIDAEKLHTILDNLISNAVKYTPDGGEISIRAMESRASLAMALSAKSMVTIEVKDTGPGISESNKSGIFSAFYHGEQASKSLVASSGLGLFIAKEAADALNAELSLIPSQIGAHFILRIPLITQ
jgi:two-component system sensor histidine kinase GlrK